MFPIAFSAGDINDRTLKADDIAGISDIYGNATFQRQTGSISGKVTKNGRGVLGAHVVAFNPATGKLVGGFSLSDDGSFVIAGLEPGPQVLRVEPLDDGDIYSFFDETMNIDVDFQGDVLRQGRRRAARRRRAEHRDQGGAEVSAPDPARDAGQPAARSARPRCCSCRPRPRRRRGDRRRGPSRPARPAPHAGSWEISGGFLWQGGFDLGDRDAELTRNPATGTGPYDLFTLGLVARRRVSASRAASPATCRQQPGASKAACASPGRA